MLPALDALALGQRVPVRADGLGGLARGYYATGRLGDAITLLNDIIARGEQTLPPGDPLMLRMRESLTNITG